MFLKTLDKKQKFNLKSELNFEKLVGTQIYMAEWTLIYQMC